ncbi:hypothetical protein EYF80_052120 [Liparis tanakae]|uniref:Uncharacterized protein n=1 Tax=Liparis tanakae TaxID=230148 RepID=A0A4Z2F934_9TELE|nr:hypothetical protein EYF80_052120 [Liparis tanakae]
MEQGEEGRRQEVGGRRQVEGGKSSDSVSHCALCWRTVESTRWSSGFRKRRSETIRSPEPDASNSKTSCVPPAARRSHQCLILCN